MNTLYYGDNLIVLREHLADESVDLIYLDPPFNSIEDLLDGREGPRYPDMARGGLNFKKAKKEKKDNQQKLFE